MLFDCAKMLVLRYFCLSCFNTSAWLICYQLFVVWCCNFFFALQPFLYYKSSVGFILQHAECWFLITLNLYQFWYEWLFWKNNLGLYITDLFFLQNLWTTYFRSLFIYLFSNFFVLISFEITKLLISCSILIAMLLCLGLSHLLESQVIVIFDAQLVYISLSTLLCFPLNIKVVWLSWI